MEEDIRGGRVNCVLVKDLSRFGRNYIEVGRYLEREFPARGVRFIAINDHVDSAAGRYDMLLPMKNIFNTQYARDISDKVRSAIRTKQERGEFVGAFASYGTGRTWTTTTACSSPPPCRPGGAADFRPVRAGVWKAENRQDPQPGEYSQPQRVQADSGRAVPQRPQDGQDHLLDLCHRPPDFAEPDVRGQHGAGQESPPDHARQGRQKAREDWAVVPDTHEAIILPEQWERVQALLARRTRELSFEQNQSPFAGFLRCGDCGRAMVKTRSAGGIYYSCGSYKRYGPTVCSKHSISHAVLENLNRVLSAVKDAGALVEEAAARTGGSASAEGDRLEADWNGSTG